jgi:hypothetical protein
MSTHFSQVLEPQIQIRSKSILLYYLPTIRPPRGNLTITKPAYSGTVTGGVAKRIRRAIDILVQSNPPKMIYNPVTKNTFPFSLNFVTMTIASEKVLGAKFCYTHLLKPFIRKMGKLGNMSYVWKAEFQKRGQLHYHVATNVFLPWQDIRSTWNNLQRKARLLDEFALKHGNFNPNGTDVHSFYSIKDVGSYMSKYMSKDNTASVNGKTWDCSKNLKKPFFAFTPSSEHIEVLRNIESAKGTKKIELEHCTILKCSNPLEILNSSNLADYQKWVS